MSANNSNPQKNLENLEAPDITHVHYEQGSLYVEWTPHGGTTFDVSLIAIGQKRTEYTATTNSITINTQLDTRVEYQVCVFAVDGIVPGPQSILYTVITAPANITSAGYGMQSGNFTVSVGWDTLTAATQYDVTLSDSSGTAITNQTCTNNSCNITTTLHSTITYNVKVNGQSNNGIVSGPASTAVTLITAAPILKTLEYYSNGNLSASWGSLTGAEQYTAKICKTDGTAVQNSTTSQCEISMKADLNALTNYNVTVRAESANGKVTGPDSNVMQPIVATSEITSISCNSNTENSFDLSWNAVPTAEQYIVTLCTVNSKKNYYTPDTSYRITDVDITKKYSVYIIPMKQGGSILGPAGTAQTPIVISPALSFMKYSIDEQTSLGTLFVEWTNIDAQYTVVLSQSNGTVVASENTSTASYTFNQTLDPSKTYNVKIKAKSSNGIVIGPFSNPIEPLTASTSLTKLQYDVTNGAGKLAVDWNSNDIAQGYIVSLACDTVEEKSTSNLSYVFSETLNTSKQYKVQIRITKLNGTIIGPGSPSMSPIIIMPAINTIGYSTASGQGSLTIGWGSVANAASYDAVIGVSGGTEIDTKTVTGTSCQFSITLDKNKTYCAKAKAKDTSGVIIGPFTEPQTLFSTNI